MTDSSTASFRARAPSAATASIRRSAEAGAADLRVDPQRGQPGAGRGSSASQQATMPDPALAVDRHDDHPRRRRPPSAPSPPAGRSPRLLEGLGEALPGPRAGRAAAARAAARPRPPAAAAASPDQRQAPAAAARTKLRKAPAAGGWRRSRQTSVSGRSSPIGIASTGGPSPSTVERGTIETPSPRATSSRTLTSSSVSNTISGVAARRAARRRRCRAGPSRAGSR